VNCISARAAAAALAAILLAIPAAAQTSTTTGPAPAAASDKAEDPNKMICEKQEVIGSRLGTRRVCRTRAQWADLQLQDRQEVERVQVQRGMKGE
jgi:invasion protein IalB